MLVAVAAVAAASPAAGEIVPASGGFPQFEARSLDGAGNNKDHPTWGRSGTQYPRVATASYADGIAVPFSNPPPRYISNRVFNDLGQNVFSEHNLSQWGWTWGQFMDHTFGLAQGGGESAPIPFDANDPLEGFRDDLGTIGFTRDAAAPGTGTSTSNPRQAVNTVSSYIDAWNVYGGTDERLEWLRRGPVDGDLTNNGGRLLMKQRDAEFAPPEQSSGSAPDVYLPRATTRGDAGAAPRMNVDGQLLAHPQDAVVTGDVRGNENMALTAVHTLFAREHNRIVERLPSWLSAEQRFQVARRVVGAEEQYVTYNEFLPALGVKLAPYEGYKPNVDASLTTEFATVGYRMHSMIHGEFEITEPASLYSADQVQRLEDMGVEVELSEDTIELAVPLTAAFFNPDLVELLGEGPIMKALGAEAQYKNDEQFDNALRSVLFEVPGESTSDPSLCFGDPIEAAEAGCFQGVTDLGAIDIARERDHGIPAYNRLREAYGLPPATSFEQITGEDTASFPSDPLIDPNDPINDPNILDFVDLRDAEGNSLPPGTDEGAIIGTRRAPLAARLQAIYGDVDSVDAFVGMISEPHVPGSELGELQLAIWQKQFAALRDGDRFFYANDPVLPEIHRRFCITYKHTLAELIALNTDVPGSDLAANVFFAP